MNKIELIEKLSERLEMDKKEVTKVLEGFEALVIEYLKKGEEVTLTGFGTFIAKYRAARGGVNPQKPNERIKMPEMTVPKFRAGKTLKDALKKKSAPVENIVQAETKETGVN